jgi:hypothetical protein
VGKKSAPIISTVENTAAMTNSHIKGVPRPTHHGEEHIIGSDDDENREIEAAVLIEPCELAQCGNPNTEEHADRIKKGLSGSNESRRILWKLIGARS